MNRAQRRKITKMPKAKAKPKNNVASIVATGAAATARTMPNAQVIVDNLPIPAIVAGINNLLGQLEHRKIAICDWDDPGRQLYRLQMRRGKIYYLAAGEDLEKE